MASKGEADVPGGVSLSQRCGSEMHFACVCVAHVCTPLCRHESRVHCVVYRPPEGRAVTSLFSARQWGGQCVGDGGQQQGVREPGPALGGPLGAFIASSAKWGHEYLCYRDIWED